MSRLIELIDQVKLRWKERIDLWRDYPLPDGSLLGGGKYQI